MLGRMGLGVLVTHGPEGLAATHLPFVIDPERRLLIGHIARANPHARPESDGEALVIFQGASAYVSASLYATKAENPRTVPTWNYEAVHVAGRLSWFSEPDRLQDVVERVSDRFEAGRAEPWSVTDAPADYVERLLQHVVGLELAVTSIVGKRKLSQNQPEVNRRSVIAGLERGATGDREVADFMRELG